MNIRTDKMQILVGVSIVPNNNNSEIVSLLGSKIEEYNRSLRFTNLNLQDIIFGLKQY